MGSSRLSGKDENFHSQFKLNNLKTNRTSLYHSLNSILIKNTKNHATFARSRYRSHLTLVIGQKILYIRTQSYVFNKQLGRFSRIMINRASKLKEIM